LKRLTDRGRGGDGGEVSYHSVRQDSEWWPANLGTPSAVGARYAVFPRRLAIKDGTARRSLRYRQPLNLRCGPSADRRPDSDIHQPGWCGFAVSSRSVGRVALPPEFHLPSKAPHYRIPQLATSFTSPPLCRTSRRWRCAYSARQQMECVRQLRKRLGRSVQVFADQAATPDLE
jgi:hypothetical protein